MEWTRARDLGDRIRETRQAAGLSQTAFGELAGVRGQQVSDWETGRSQPAKSRLERIASRVGAPVTIFAEGGPRPQDVLAAGGSPGIDEAEGEPPEGPGWVFGDPTEAEAQFRTFLRATERTLRAMVGRPDLFATEELRVNQLAACRAAMRSAELAGRPVPAWLHQVYNEVISGTFH